MLDHKSILDADNPTPSATQANLYEISLRLDALDGGRITEWKCDVGEEDILPAGTFNSMPAPMSTSSIYQTIQTIGRETPAQLGYSDCQKVTP